MNSGSGLNNDNQNLIKINIPEIDKKFNNTIPNFNRKTEKRETRSNFLQIIGSMLVNNPTKLPNNNTVTFKRENTNNFNSHVPNLKLAIDQLDLIPENEEKEEDENKINNINLFKNFKIDKEKVQIVENKLDDINTFNNTIMSAKNWGENNIKSDSNKDNMGITNYFKPNKKIYEKELGRSIIDTKFPRARLPNRFMEQQIIAKSVNMITKATNKKEKEIKP